MTSGIRSVLTSTPGDRREEAVAIKTQRAGRNVHHEAGETWRAMAMTTHTVRLHRVLRATPERVYRAFLEPDAMVGGTYKMSFTNFATGQSHSFGGEFLELVRYERIRHTDTFDDPNLPGEMRTTVSLKQVSCGTELNVVQEGIPEAIPPEACYLGWQDSLALLAQLVEAEIPA